MAADTLDRLLTALAVRLHAFSVCSIQQGWRLAFPSFEAVTVHYVLKGSGALRVGNGRWLAFAPQSVLIVPARQPHVAGEARAAAHLAHAADRCTLLGDGLVGFTASSLNSRLNFRRCTLDLRSGGKPYLGVHQTGSSSLNQAFQRERQQAYAWELAAYHRERMRQERLNGLRGVLRREGFPHHHTERKTREAEERRLLREQHPVPSWQGFLEADATHGSAEALAALRGRPRQQNRVEAQLRQAADAGEARHILHQHLRPAVRRDGRVIYRVDDGGLVSDESKARARQPGHRRRRLPRPHAGRGPLRPPATRRAGDGGPVTAEPKMHFSRAQRRLRSQAAIPLTR